MTKKPDTVTGLLAAAVAAGPDAPALHYKDAAISYGELEAQAMRVAGGLRALGIGAGDRVALWLPNCPAYLIFYFACARLGAIAVAVNTGFRAVEVADIIGRSGAKVLALWPGFRQIPFLDILAEIDPAALARLETLMLYDEGEAVPETPLADKRTVAFAELEAAAPYEADHATPDSPCNIFTTSGTTRAPKFVLHRQAAIALHAGEVVPSFGLDRGETSVFNPLPLCGVFGFCIATMAIAGARPQIVEPAFDAARAVELMQRHRVTHFSGPDDMIHRMLEIAPEQIPFPDLRFVGYAAFNAALEDLPERAAARGMTLIGLWGMSEMQALVFRRDETLPPAERLKPGGRPISANIKARVRNPETGRLNGPGEPGELEITGPGRMVGYFENPEATAEALTEDGYVRTGDLGEMEPDGGIHFIARMGDVLRLGGFLVSPAEIESHVQEHAGVAGAQVVAVATEQGNRPVAFVTLNDGTSLDEAVLADHCAAGLARFKQPVRFIALDAFPVTESPNGLKIQRAKLRQMAEEALG